MKWKDSEVKFLKSHYVIFGSEGCAASLGRSVQSVKKKAQSLKIKKDETYKTISNIHVSYWKSIGYKANKRNIKLLITKEQAIEKFNQQNGKCALSGMKLFLAQDIYQLKKGLQTASLDRIDSSLHYSKDNIQWVHKTINKIKNNVNEEEFILYCWLVSKNKGLV